MNWKPCPSYSDEAIRGMGLPAEQIPAFRAQMKRLECGTVNVPLDHSHPGGRKISIAITRLGAVDRKHRLGAITVLPGGPGNYGYLDPVLRVMLRNQESARLNDRYDIIGFDPRGVNYSTKVDCENPPRPPGGQPGTLTEEAAHRMYDAQVADNGSCGRSDPAFLRQLTTANVAKDLDLVRAALGELRLNLLGVSWGTWLGVLYRSTFPGHTGRVFLDSVAPPWTRLDEHVAGNAAAAERNFGRMAAWLARNDKTYGLGATAEQVREAVLRLRRDYEENPRTFTDLRMPVDGMAVADLARRSSPDWPRAGKALAELLNATGGTAPPTVKEIFGAEPGRPAAGTPEWANMTMNRAVMCNEDSSRQGFSSAWADYQQRLERYPVTGPAFGFGAGCAGWPLPVQETRVKRGSGPLVLAGHRHEFMSAYEWTLQTWRAVGGKVYTVDDDVHGSATRVPECAVDVVRYFNTGRIDHGCDGTKLPAS
ncbi:alpha/beta fold hydrolase [Nonomuraea sediminis]|uniref:alpha/beta fold hydrolase n=1 Tax=Nonomuraea sediminis TaxID=2835864 RepID=UPI001BDD7EF5|nr:alpha/beta hydrolase [Nonomuraea sediminis]